MQLFSNGAHEEVFLWLYVYMCLPSLGPPPGFTVSVPLGSSIDLSTYTLIIGRKQWQKHSQMEALIWTQRN